MGTPSVLELARAARAAARDLALATTEVKDRALRAMAEAMERVEGPLLAANAEDVAAARREGNPPAFLDRLTVTPARIRAVADGLRQVAALPDPVGQVTGMVRRPNGLLVGRMRVPLGVIGFIYESRPGVTADAAGVCLRSGNAVVLRGGREALGSNRVLARALAEAAEAAGLPAGCLGFVDSPDRGAVADLLKLDQYLDLIVPRGGPEMIRAIREQSAIPVLGHGPGICHTYVDAGADHAMAEAIAFNAKVERPSVCNAMETLLVHAAEAPGLLPRLMARYRAAGVEVRGCPRTRALVPDVVPASEADWDTEYLDLILAVKVVESYAEAVAHIARHGSGLAEAIVTRDHARALRFLREVDAAAVFVNASTRFTDGGEFGLGAEIGISTQKLHARGPMGLAEMTCEKYVVLGDGQVRESRR